MHFYTKPTTGEHTFTRKTTPMIEWGPHYYGSNFHILCQEHGAFDLARYLSYLIFIMVVSAEQHF